MVGLGGSRRQIGGPPTASTHVYRIRAATLAARLPVDPTAPAPNYDSRAPFTAPGAPIRTRPLGTVPVKGRAELVEIFAVE